MECRGLGYRLRQIESSAIVRCGDLFILDFVTATTDWQTAATLEIDDLSIVRVAFEVDARQGDGTDRASFRREALFYREGGSPQIEGPDWHTPLTIRSQRTFEVEYELSTTAISFRVKAAASASTNWSGCLHVYVTK